MDKIIPHDVERTIRNLTDDKKKVTSRKRGAIIDYFIEVGKEKRVSLETENNCINAVGYHRYSKHPFLFGNLHREDGPAEIYYYKNGNVECEIYRQENGLHRIGGPAVIRYNKNGNIELEKYMQDSRIHREDGPAVVYYYDDGNIKREEYYQNDKLHRINSASIMIFHENGNPKELRYYQNDLLHRDNGPAIIKCSPEGIVEEEDYCLEGLVVYGGSLLIYRNKARINKIFGIGGKFSPSLEDRQIAIVTAQEKKSKLQNLTSKASPDNQCLKL